MVRQDTKQQRDLEQRVANILSSHEGKSNAITSGEIAERLDLDEEHDTNPVSRSLIRRVIVNHDLPIGSCNSGYYVISNRSELRDYESNLDRRIEGIKLRKRVVKRKYWVWERQKKRIGVVVQGLSRFVQYVKNAGSGPGNGGD